MTSTHQDGLQRWHFAILACCIVTWFVTLGNRVLMDPDEGRYAEIPREMVASGDWLSPHLNDLKYFEKPPLQYWATAVSYKVFGIGEFTSRLWCGLTGLLGVLFTGWAAAKLFGRNTGVLAVALLGCSLIWIVLGHLNTLDMSLSFFLSTAIFAFLLAQQAPIKSKAERNWMFVAWIAAALGVLTKGPIAAALPGLALVVYSIIERDLSTWRRLHVVGGLILFLAITAPWFIAMSIVNPEFAHYFFIHEHFERFTSDVHSRNEPWWFFIPLLVAGALPWFFMAAHSWISQWRVDAIENVSGFRSRRFLLIWAASVFLFFSASHSKLGPYILPIFPALAVVATDFISRAKIKLLSNHVMVIVLLWLCALGYLLFYPAPQIKNASPALAVELFHWGQAMAATALIGAVIGWWLISHNRPRDAIIAMSTGTFLGISALLVGMDAARETRSSYDLTEAIKPHHDANKPFYSIGDYAHSMSFYLQRALTLVDYQGAGEKDLDFGQSQEPNKRLTDIASFVQAWSRDPVGSIAVITKHDYQLLAEQHVPMTVIGRNIDLIAVSKP
jgi:4-amino-4-deoxy-L-arabinose transferase-like glycosyltransferase